MKIHTEINLALAECHTLTGEKATRIYLGRSQMDRLMRFARENNYYGNNHCPAQILRNCVHPKLGEQIYQAAIAV